MRTTLLAEGEMGVGQGVMKGGGIDSGDEDSGEGDDEEGPVVVYSTTRFSGGWREP